MFILELTLRSWNHSEENKRRTLQRNDIAAAITRTDIFDFLVCACFRNADKKLHPTSAMHDVYFREVTISLSMSDPKNTAILVCRGCYILQVDIVPREERDDAAMVPRVPQPLNGPMPGEGLSKQISTTTALDVCTACWPLWTHCRA